MKPHLDQIPDYNIPPCSGRCASAAVQHEDLAGVDIVVTLMSVVVVVNLLGHVDEEHEGEREDGGEPGGGGQARDELCERVGRCRQIYMPA